MWNTMYMYSLNVYPKFPGNNKYTDSSTKMTLYTPLVKQQKFVKHYAPGANRGKKAILAKR